MGSTTRPDARNLPEAIQWHEGMLLAPQHFQQMSVRSEAVLGYHAMMLSPFHWGIRRFEYDRALLVGGILRVLELEAVMPDGLVVSLRDDEHHELEIDLNAYRSQMTSRPLTVHLAVPSRKGGGMEVDDDLARYRSVVTMGVTDENTGDDGIEIPRLRPRLTLIPGEVPPSRYVTFPLFRIASRDEMFVSDDFVPPVIRVELTSEIGRFCNDVSTCLREKSLVLANEIRNHYFDMGPSEVLEKQSKIQSLVEPLPLLEGMINTGVSHPYTLYLGLCSVVGHVATLGAAMVPPKVADYDHNDLWRTFKSLRDMILAMVDEGIWDEFTVLAFTLRNGVFCRSLESGWITGPLLIGIKGAPRVSEQDVNWWIEESLIGSESLMGSLRNRRIRGAVRTRCNVEKHLAARGLLFYEIHVDQEFITQDEVLQIMNLGERSGNVSEISLFVRNTPDGQKQ